MLQGKRITDTLIMAAAQQASTEIEPDSDIHASADYRRHLAGILVTQALTQVVNRANGGIQSIIAAVQDAAKRMQAAST